MDWNDIFIRARGNPPLCEGKERSDLILMQFTGLKDKNGKEIYEGDIVKTPAMLGEIEYRESEVGFKLVEMGNGYYGEDFHLHSPLEVIGNIYENPDKLDPSYPSFH